MTLVGLGSIRRSLAAGPEAPRAARHAVEFLAGYVDDDLLETSRLVVTELVTNSPGPANRAVGLAAQGLPAHRGDR